jgi:hypothetical protein
MTKSDFINKLGIVTCLGASFHANDQRGCWYFDGEPNEEKCRVREFHQLLILLARRTTVANGQANIINSTTNMCLFLWTKNGFTQVVRSWSEKRDCGCERKFHRKQHTVLPIQIPSGVPVLSILITWRFGADWISLNYEIQSKKLA